MWHFFGAIALFLTLMTLLTLDDNLKKEIERDPGGDRKDFRVYKLNNRPRPITIWNEY